MSENITPERDKYINLSNVATLISFILLMAITFSLVRNEFYYQILLHIPIFQYVDASEIALMTPATGLVWISLIGSLSLSNFVIKSTEFSSFQKIVFPVIILLITLSFYYISYRNVPVFREVNKGPWLYNYWYIYIPALLLFLFAYSFTDGNAPLFIRNNRFIIPLVLTIWYGLFQGWADYETVKTSSHINNIIVQTKLLGVIKTDSILVDAGRTKNFWFFYNRNTHLTRAIKADDIEFVDFDEQNR